MTRDGPRPRPVPLEFLRDEIARARARWEDRARSGVDHEAIGRFWESFVALRDLLYDRTGSSGHRSHLEPVRACRECRRLVADLARETARELRR